MENPGKIMEFDSGNLLGPLILIELSHAVLELLSIDNCHTPINVHLV